MKTHHGWGIGELLAADHHMSDSLRKGALSSGCGPGGRHWARESLGGRVLAEDRVNLVDAVVDEVIPCVNKLTRSY